MASQLITVDVELYDDKYSPLFTLAAEHHVTLNFACYLDEYEVTLDVTGATYAVAAFMAAFDEIEHG